MVVLWMFAEDELRRIVVLNFLTIILIILSSEKVHILDENDYRIAASLLPFRERFEGTVAPRFHVEVPKFLW